MQGPALQYPIRRTKLSRSADTRFVGGEIPKLNYEQLLKTRLAIARLGEADNAGWWNTRDLLGSNGAFVFRRGFPSTHLFAQARAAFAIATSRCQALFAAPHCVTLWRLPADIEDQFEDRWQGWLDGIEQWRPFFEQISSVHGSDVLGTLQGLGLISDREVSAVRRLPSPDHQPSLPLGSVASGHHIDEDAVRLLAAAFARSEPRNLVVPFIRLAAWEGA